MRLLKAIAQALAVFFGMLLVANAISFLVRHFNIDGMTIVGLACSLIFIGFLTATFYIFNDKEK